MTKILVIGIAGRMGKTIAECIEGTEGVQLGGGTEFAGSSFIGQDIGEVKTNWIQFTELCEGDILRKDIHGYVIDTWVYSMVKE